MSEKLHIGLTVALFLCMSVCVRAQGEQPYLCELGLQGGCGYYVGDGADHIFMHPREAYGVLFRYKFTKRWALQVKTTAQRITGWNHDEDMHQLDTKWENQLINTDIVAEFNFFRFGSANRYDKRIKPYTPYIFLGLGAGVYGANGYRDGNYNHVMAYLPFGIGFKWKFSDRVGLNIAWQHNIYLSDDIENGLNLNDRYAINGSNIMNCDLTGMLTAGIVFEFARAKKPCRICNY